jgi:hypothetical protein
MSCISSSRLSSRMVPDIFGQLRSSRLIFCEINRVPFRSPSQHLPWPIFGEIEGFVVFPLDNRCLGFDRLLLLVNGVSSRSP